MKEWIVEHLTTDGGKLIAARCSQLAYRHPAHWSKIVAATSFLPPGATVAQRLRTIIDGHTDVPKCSCGEPVKWLKGRYTKFCGHRCANIDINSRPETLVKHRTNGAATPFRKHLPPDELRALHHDGRMILPDLAGHFGVSVPTVVKHMKRHGIEIRNNARSSAIVVPSKDELISLHHNERMTMGDVADHYGVHVMTLRKWFRDLGVEQIDYMDARRTPCPLTKAQLVDLHHDKKWSVLKIATHLNVGHAMVKSWLERHDVEPRLYGGSDGEREIREFLNSLNAGIFSRDRTVLGGKEIDSYCDELKFGVEYCGLYWHRSDRVGAKYHYDKWRAARDGGVKLITIFEHEWRDRRPIVESILTAVVGAIPIKIGARECTVAEGDRGKIGRFLAANHLQGTPHSISRGFVLLHQGEIVAAMTFSPHHRQNGGGDVVVLSRLCFKTGVSVVGGASKLFSATGEFIAGRRVITWSDNRWSDGRVYEKLGFSKDADLPADYFYADDAGDVHSKQSQRKRAVGCPKEVTEREWASGRGFFQVHDCGKTRWSFHQTHSQP